MEDWSGSVSLRNSQRLDLPGQANPTKQSESVGGEPEGAYLGKWVYHSTEREVGKDHLRKSEANQWEREHLPYLVMALVADGGGKQVWVSSPIRAGVEAAGTRTVEGLRAHGEQRRKPYKSDVLRDSAWLCIEMKSGEPRNSRTKIVRTVPTIYPLDPTVVLWDCVLSFGGCRIVPSWKHLQD